MASLDRSFYLTVDITASLFVDMIELVITHFFLDLVYGMIFYITGLVELAMTIYLLIIYYVCDLL